MNNASGVCGRTGLETVCSVSRTVETPGLERNQLGSSGVKGSHMLHR